MTSIRPTRAILLAGALMLAACGDDAVDDVMPDDDGAVDEAPADDATGDDATGEDGGDDEAAADSEIRVVDNDFDPDQLDVAAGDTVTWTHEGGIPHNVTFEDGESSDTLETGDTFERTFDEAGTFDYACTLHPGMTGSVEVS